jgi:hypothetical protein
VEIRAPLLQATTAEISVCAPCHSRREQIAEAYTAGAPFEDYYSSSLITSGLYYPDGAASVISRFGVDVPYTLAYLIWIIGIFRLRQVTREQRPSAEVLHGTAPIFGHVLIFLQADDSLQGFSPNLGTLIETRGLTGVPFARLPLLSAHETTELLDTLHSGRGVADLQGSIKDRSGLTRQLTLNGAPIRDPGSGYTGAQLLLELPVDDPNFDVGLDSSLRATARYVLDRSGSQYKQRAAKFLTDYHLRRIHALTAWLRRRANPRLVSTLVRKLRALAESRGWPFGFDAQGPVSNTQLDLDLARRALPALQTAVREFAEQAFPPQAIDEVLDIADAELEPAVHLRARQLLAPGGELRFSDAA